MHGTTKRQVAAMFAEERPTLLSLPLEPFRYYQSGERTVHLVGCVEVESAYDCAPPDWICHRIRVQWNLLQVRLLEPVTGQFAAGASAATARRASHPITPQLLHRTEKPEPISARCTKPCIA